MKVGPIVAGGKEDRKSNIVKNDARLAFMFVDETGVGDRMIKEDGVFAILVVKISEDAPEGLTVLKVVNQYAFSDYNLNLLPVSFVDGGVDVGEEIVPVGGYTISGYIAPDFLYGSSVEAELLSGYRVEVEGTELYTVTDAKGYFEINEVPENAEGYTLTITKDYYITRYVDVAVNDDVNVSTASSPLLIWAGDVEVDGILNIYDLSKVITVYNSIPGEEGYSKELDINRDGAINMEDITIILKNFGKDSSHYSK